MTKRQAIDFSGVLAAIADALRDEERTSRLHDALRRTYGAATEHGVVEMEFERIRNAIAAVPDRLAAAAALDVPPKDRAHVRRVLLDIVAYWNAPNDILPDHAGLPGRIDDALVSHLLLAKLCRWKLETTGVEPAALAGQFDLDLRQSMALGLDALISTTATDIWDQGFDRARPGLKAWKAEVFFSRPRKVASHGRVRGGLAEAPAAPATTTHPATAPSTRAAAPASAGGEPQVSDSDPRLYEIWFGTNRAPADPRDLSRGFGGARDDRVYYGVCEVAIPKTHKFGSIGTSWWRRWLRLEFADDHVKVVRRRSIDTAATFFEELKDELASSDGKQLLFYLHGFNVSFDEAAIRAAQLFADLKVPGAAAFFSWPSKASVDDYVADIDRIGESDADIAAFLTALATKLGGATVHIIAHSMGNRGLARAMQRITTIAAGTAGVRFGQIILAAPDISVRLFQDLARVYPAVSKRTTMYVSGRDRALGLSKWLQDAPRAGFTPPVTVVSNIDTIEVTDIDVTLLGHSYYAEAEAVLYDIASLLRHDVAPGQRPRLRSGNATGSSAYWVIGA